MSSAVQQPDSRWEKAVLESCESSEKLLLSPRGELGKTGQMKGGLLLKGFAGNFLMLKTLTEHIIKYIGWSPKGCTVVLLKQQCSDMCLHFRQHEVKSGSWSFPVPDPLLSPTLYPTVLLNWRQKAPQKILIVLQCVNFFLCLWCQWKPGIHVHF